MNGHGNPEDFPFLHEDLVATLNSLKSPSVARQQADEFLAR